MNKSCYRHIFNKARGLLMAVAEIVSSHDRGSGRSSRRKTTARTPSFPRSAAALLLCAGLLFPLHLQAQIVADANAPGSQQATVLAAPNDVPLVNIQTPSEAGVSRNTYQQFDVESRGAILNNARTSAQTELGGWVAGNPWLATGSAEVILNEVNSSDPSQLNGYLEVAGQRAQVVIANPAGVTCEDCGFINASRTTLTTGTPIVNQGALDGYRVEGGTISINGEVGLDTSRSDYSELIAKSVEVNAGIWAQDLKVVSGSNEVSAAGESVAAVADSALAADTPAAVYGIDVARLGGMYAGKIVLMGTDRGVGVNSEGVISGGELTLSADGQLHHSGTIAVEESAVISSSSVVNQGLIASDGGLAVASGQIDNQGTLSALDVVELQAEEIVNSGDIGAITLDITAGTLSNQQGQIVQSGLETLTIETGQLVNSNQALLGAHEQAPERTAAEKNPSSEQTSDSGATVSISSEELASDSEAIAAAAPGHIVVTGQLLNDAGEISAATVELQIHDSFSNTGEALVNVARLDQRSGTLNNADARLFVAEKTALLLDSFSNQQGRIETGSDFRLQTGQFDNREGVLLSDGDIAVTGSALDNRAGVVQATKNVDLTATAGGIDNGGGTLLSSDSALQLGSAAEINNSSGTIAAATRVAMSAGTALENGSGLVQSGEDLVITAATAVNNAADGLLYSGTQLTIEASRLNNAGTIAAQSQLGVKVADQIENQGTLSAAEALQIQSGSMTNSGSVNAATFDIVSSQLGNSGQLVQSSLAALDIHAATVINKNAALIGSVLEQSGDDSPVDTAATDEEGASATPVDAPAADSAAPLEPVEPAASGRIVVAETLVNDAGQIGAEMVTLTVSERLDNSSASLIAVASLDHQGSELSNDNAQLIAGRISELSLERFSNSAARLETLADLEVEAGQFDNSSGVLLGGGDISLAGAALNNSGGQIQSSGMLTLTAEAGIDNRAGALLSTSDIQLNSTGAIDNSAGTIAAGDNATLASTAALLNDRGLIQTGGDLTITSAATVDNASAGLIYAAGKLDVFAAELVNSGTLSAADEATLKLSASLLNSGEISSQENMSIAAATLQNQQGTILANDNIGVDAQTLENTAGLIASNATLTITADQIDNQQTGDEQGLSASQIDLRATQLDNSNGTINAMQSLQATVSQALDNRAGSILANGTLELFDPNRLDPATKELAISNSDGLIAGESTLIDANSLSNDGRVEGEQIGISLVADYRNDSGLSAVSTLSFETLGHFINNALLSAGDELFLSAGNIENTASGAIAADHILLQAVELLANRGLINAASLAHLTATSLTNIGSGAIYADHVAIAAEQLVNREETSADNSSSAVIAAREQLDIGAQTIVNREESELLSLGALHVGGQLDENLQASGQAAVLDNLSARIESGTEMSLAAEQINNLNLHLETVQVVDEPIYSEKVRPKGSSVWYDISECSGIFGGQDKNYCSGFSGSFEDYWVIREYATLSHTEVLSTAPAIISVGTDLMIDGLLYNQDSHVIAGGTITTTQSPVNEATKGQDMTTFDGSTIEFSKVVSCGLFGGSHCRDDEGEQPYEPAPVYSLLYDLPTTVYQQQGSVAVSDSTAACQSYQSATTAAVAATATAAAVDTTEVGGVPLQLPEGSSQSYQAVATGEFDIRSASPNLRLPNSTLLRVDVSDPSGLTPLVETDPRFTNYRQWLSSDYLLEALQLDPATAQKRLGDGLYEQRLIREQVAELTGRRFLEGYSSDLEQYKALMNAAVTFAERYDLIPGVALTTDQMSQLTSDIVWLVEQQVTLPNGDTQSVLAPQVYAAVKPDAVDGSGALLSGDKVISAGAGELVNSGTIYGRNLVQLSTTDSISNLNGQIVADTLVLDAQRDISNSGGRLVAEEALLLQAGRDVNSASALYQSEQRIDNSDFSRTAIENVASLSVNGAEGVLLIQAGNDIDLQAAGINNNGVTTQLNAGNDIRVSSLEVAEQNNAVWDSKNQYVNGTTRQVGTNLNSEGDIVLASGNNIAVSASTIESQSGQVVLSAENDLGIEAGQNSSNLDEKSYSKTSGFLSSKKTTTHTIENSTTVESAYIGGNEVVLDSGNDIRISGSDIVSDSATLINAGNDISITSATETSESLHYSKVERSGLMSSGGIGFSIGRAENSEELMDRSTYQRQSLVGSLAGDTFINAGNRYEQTGSTVMSPAGDVVVNAQQVDINAAYDSYRGSEEYRSKSSGLTVALSGTVATAINALKGTADSAGDIGSSGHSRVNAMAAANTVWQGYQAVEAVQTAASDPTNVGVSVTVGSSKSKSETEYQGTQAVGSRISAENVSISAAGAGEQSDIAIIGSDVVGTGSTVLSAESDINLLAAQSTDEQHSSNSSSGWNAGVALTFGSGGMSAGITAGGNVGKGQADGESLSYSNSHVGSLAGTTVLDAGETTTLRGAQVLGDSVTLASNNLIIESLQDTASYDSDQMNAGGQVTIGSGFSASANYSQSDINADYASVTEQSGIIAGDGGYNVTVKEHSDLTGGIITSTQAAEDTHLNSFSTGTLALNTIENHSNASADSMGVGASYSYHNSDAADNEYYNPDATGKYDVAKQIAGNLVDNAKESESLSSTTYSGIHTQNITITDENAQLALTGETTKQTIEQINQDIKDLANSLEQIDYKAMADDVAIQRKFNNTLNQVAIKFTDEAYLIMFIKEHPFVEVTKDENGKLVKRELSQEEVNNLPKDSNGKVNVSINGIFNDADAAALYADQHANSDGPVYAIVFPEASNFVSELLVAGYQKFLENDFWGLTNSTQELKGTMVQYGNTGLDVDAHSRGAMTTGNAMESLASGGYANVLTGTSVNLFGPAYSAQTAANMLNTLSGGAQTSVNLQNHTDDFVGRYIGGNPSTGGDTPPDSSTVEEWYKMFINPATAHSCYGNGGGKGDCQYYWGPDWEKSNFKTMIINANNGGKE